MEQIFKQDYDFEPIPLRKFKALIETMENSGATHIKIGYYQDDHPYVVFGKEDPQDLLKAFQKAEETCEKSSKSLNIAYDYMKRIIDNLKKK